MKPIKKIKSKRFNINLFSIAVMDKEKKYNNRVFTAEYIKAIETKTVNYLSKSNYLNAYKEYKKIVEIGIFNTKYITDYAVICQINGEVAEAYRLYTRAIDIYPNNSKIYYNLSILLKIITIMT